MNHFQHQKLLSWRDYYNEFISPFLIKTISLEDQEVNLDLCIGTDHPNYINKTWYDLYHGGLQRGESNIEAMKYNPYYYLSPERKESFSFLKHKEKYFIESGNHRTVVGRYYLNSLNKKMLQGVHVKEYITDLFISKAYATLSQDKGLKVRVLRNKISDFGEDGECLLLISSLNNQQGILFDNSCLESFFSVDKSQEKLISDFAIRAIKHLPNISALLFACCPNYKKELEYKLGYIRSWQIWSDQPKVKRLWDIRDIQKSKVVREITKLFCKS
jgi:hypothetical protein